MTSPFPKRIALISSALALALASFSALSGNWGWLKNTPVEAFTDSDWVMLKETAKKALDSGKDGETILWVNHDTGHSGSITPLNTVDRNALPYRNTKFFNSADGRTCSSKTLLCKQQDGKWKIAP